MNRCGIEISYKNVPKLDPQFIPMEQFTRAYLKGANSLWRLRWSGNRLYQRLRNLYSRHRNARGFLLCRTAGKVPALGKEV